MTAAPQRLADGSLFVPKRNASLVWWYPAGARIARTGGNSPN